VRFALTDVTSEPQVQASIETALDFGGSLLGVIHCAGIVTPRRVLDKDGIVHPLDLFAKGIQVNLVGTFNVTRLAAKAMAQNVPHEQGERGVIVNTAFDRSIRWSDRAGLLLASKAGVVG